MTPWGVASLEPRGLIGRIYVGDHNTLLHTQYISCGPHGFREDVLSFIHYKSMGAHVKSPDLCNLYIFVWIQHGYLANTVFALGPSNSVIKRIYVGDH